MLAQYKNNLIVGVQFNNTFNWYLSPKILWAIDLNKALKNEKVKYVDLLNSTRQKLEILTTNNFKSFLNNMEQFKLNTLELKNDFKNITNADLNFIQDFVPSIFIDVNNKLFYVISPLTDYFKNTACDFDLKELNDLNIIPTKFQYWKD